MTSYPSPTNQGTTDHEKGLMAIRPTFIADSQPAKLMPPGRRALHAPALDTQAAAMRGPVLGQQGEGCRDAGATGDAAQSHSLGHPARRLAPPWAAPFAPHGQNRVDHGLPLRHLMPVGFREDERQRNALCLGKEMRLTPQLPSIRRRRPRLFPPPTARTEARSTTARAPSIWSASCSVVSRISCSCCQTPACCQSRSRRQQVIPEPQPSSWGSASQGEAGLQDKEGPGQHLAVV